jgi:UDP-N-acetylglucosamine 4,6-dehydratase/5-epimerase
MNILNQLDDYTYYDNKNILITGGTGTLGNILTTFFLDKTDCNKICIYSRDEFKQHQMKLKLKNHKNYNRMRFFIGDIRDADRTKYAIKDINIVFHAAALKQVDAIEYNPMEAIKTNINGTENVIMACIENNIDKLVGISTDKCVSPANLYGATKLCLEKLIIHAYEYSAYKLKTCVVRYGNVIGSRGSVVPIFLDQKDSGIFTVTNSKMTRFTLTVNEALNFVINSTLISTGGEIFVPKLYKYDLPQLCSVINKDNLIKEIGIRPGEKLHEEMLSESESLKTWESTDFFIIEDNNGLNDEIINKYSLKKITELFSYNSNNATKISNIDLKIQIETI